MKTSKRIFLFLTIFIAILLYCIFLALCADYQTKEQHAIYKLRQLEPDPEINYQKIIEPENDVSISKEWYVGRDCYYVFEHIGMGDIGGTTIIKRSF